MGALAERYGPAVVQAHAYSLFDFVKKGGIDEQTAENIHEILRAWMWTGFAMGYHCHKAEIFDKIELRKRK